MANADKSNCGDINQSSLVTAPGPVTATGAGEETKRSRTGAKEDRPAAVAGSPRVYQRTDPANAE